MGIESSHVFLFVTFVKGRIHYGVLTPFLRGIRRRVFFKGSLDFLFRSGIWSEIAQGLGA